MNCDQLSKPENVVDYECNDKDLESCPCYHRLRNVLIEYNKATQVNITDEIAHYISNINVLDILDDFLHLTLTHDSIDAFDTIVTKLGFCAINECYIFKRHCRNRDKLKNDNQQRATLYNADATMIVRHQILDKIHCYYHHSYDTGHKLSPTDQSIVNGYEYVERKCHDEDILSRNNKCLSLRQMIQHNHRGLITRINTRYNQLQLSSIDANLRARHKEFCCGTYFHYDDFDDNNWKGIDVKQRYSSLKEELTSNELSIISMKQFDGEYEKARIHFVSRYKKQYYTGITIQSLLSLMVYCNYTVLQYEFSKTYRDNIEDHDNFYHLGRCLKHTIWEFGTRNCNVEKCPTADLRINKFYHGMGQQLLPFKLMGDFFESVFIYSPLSTTSSFEVATNFTNYNEGLIIEFSSHHLAAPHYFPVAWLSDYANEKEYLFIQNVPAYRGLIINNITEAKFGIEFDVILQALQIINQMIKISGYHTWSGEDIDISPSMESLIVRLLHNELSSKISTFVSFDSLHEYAEDMVHSYFSNVRKMRIHCKNLLQNRYIFWRSLLFNMESGNLEWSMIMNLCSNLETIAIRHPSRCSMTLDNVLRYFNGQKYSPNVKQIIIEICNKDDEACVQDVVQQYKKKFETIKLSINVEKNRYLEDVVKIQHLS